MFYVYILKSEKTGRFYIGHTQNIEIRLNEHNSGKSISTKSGIPWQLVHTEKFQTRSEAMKREREIKAKKNHKSIEFIIQSKQ